MLLGVECSATEILSKILSSLSETVEKMIFVCVFYLVKAAPFYLK